MSLILVDLGTSPPSNAYLSAEDLAAPETFFPLQVLVCTQCWLVQTRDYTKADQLFAHDYAYFSSVSKTWLEHAKKYAESISDRLRLGTESLVLEIASNDGYLLKNFVAAAIPCIGIEPTASTAAAAEKLGIPVIREFFGTRLAAQLVANGQKADLIVGNNVYAHVPDINDFTAGMKAVLRTGGTITLEFPHVQQLMEQIQFDTIYHEHFSYLSLYTVERIFRTFGLRVFDVELLPTHGGSLRVFGCHDDDPRVETGSVKRALVEEKRIGMRDPQFYRAFQAEAERIKYDLVEFLVEQKRGGKVVAAYGAAAKGNTLLNYAGVRADLLPYVCDAAPSKQGRCLPGSRIPVLPPSALAERKPDFLLILPWNLAEEVMNACDHVREWGCRFVIAVPQLRALA